MGACKVTLPVAWSHCKAFGCSPEYVGGVGHDVARTPLVKAQLYIREQGLFTTAKHVTSHISIANKEQAMTAHQFRRVESKT